MGFNKGVSIGWMAVALCAAANGQLNLLTSREVAQLVDSIPAVSQERRAEPCVYYEVTFPDPVAASVGVRDGCPESGSGLFGYFVVDRRTGVVRRGLYGEQNPVVTDEAVIRVAIDLVRRAYGRTLSVEQARCLAAEAVRGELDAADEIDPISATVLGGPRQGSTTQVLVTHQFHSDGPAGTGRFVSVDVTTGDVRDDTTGLPLASAAQGALLHQLVELIEPPLLPDEDVLQIASQVPALSKLLSACSELVTNGDGTGEERQVGLRSSCPNTPGVITPVANVNLATGRVSDARSGSAFESPEAARVAAQLFARLEERRRDASAAVAKTCSAIAR